MKRYGTLTLAAVCAIALDTAVFSMRNLSGVRPWLLLAVALAAVAQYNVQSGIVVALLGGLVMDAVCNPYLGMTAACYLVSTATLHMFVRRGRPKAPLLALFAALSVLAFSPIEWLYALLGGARYGALQTFWTAVLPNALLTGVCVLPFSALLRWAQKGRRDTI